MRPLQFRVLNRMKHQATTEIFSLLTESPGPSWLWTLRLFLKEYRVLKNFARDTFHELFLLTVLKIFRFDEIILPIFKRLSSTSRALDWDKTFNDYNVIIDDFIWHLRIIKLYLLFKKSSWFLCKMKEYFDLSHVESLPAVAINSFLLVKISCMFLLCFTTIQSCNTYMIDGDFRDFKIQQISDGEGAKLQESYLKEMNHKIVAWHRVHEFDTLILK